MVADACDTGRVRRGWRVVGVLAVLALACVALTLAIRGARMQQLRALHEVVAVVDGGPGVVVVYTQDGRGRILSWQVDDAGEATDWNQEDRVRGTPRTEGCAAGVCYRVATTALQVESSVDGGRTYTTAW